MKGILWQPYKLNNLITLKNRIVMAPMTRNVADDQLVPTSAMAAYYKRRADAGLIVTEGTIIRPDARGYSNVPGIFTDAQIAGWMQVTQAVHEANGVIFSQIWHVGRVTHPHFLNGDLPISASATTMQGEMKRSKGLYYGKSRAVTVEEIQTLIADYAKAAKNAIKAGFDGIEIHGANGYLVDQFLHYNTNHRTDAYGETPENMARFAIEVVKACGEAIGYERVGIRLSPGAYLQEMVGDHRDGAVFRYLLEQLSKLNIAYVHTGNFDDTKMFNELDNMTMTAFMHKHYKGTLIACGGYTLASAEHGIDQHDFDLIAIGKPFIANHDLIYLAKKGLPIKNYDVSMLSTLY